jgi:hypothetical protein
VPEASVDEYGNSLARQNNIRAARQILAISMLAVTEGPYYPADNPLRPCVPRLHSPHDVATFSCGKCVHVFSKSNLPGCLVQCPLLWCRSELGRVKSKKTVLFCCEDMPTGRGLNCLTGEILELQTRN